MKNVAKLYYRQMTEVDIPDVFAIEEQAHQFAWTIGILKDCLKTSYDCYVMEYEQKIIGFFIALIAVGDCHILNICIDPKHQGKGFGKAILQFLLDHAKAKGVTIVLLEVRESNVKAINLYESFGFNELGRRENYYPSKNGREDAILLGLNISPRQ